MQHIKNIVFIFALGVGLNSNAQQRFSNAVDVRNGSDWTFDIIVESDGYLAFDAVKVVGDVRDSLYIFKYDFDGNELFRKRIEIRNNLNVLKVVRAYKFKDNSGYFAVTRAYHTDDGSDKTTLYLIKLDNALDTVWTKQHFREGIYRSGINDFHEDADGNIVMTGFTAKDVPVTQIGGYFLKTDKDGNVLSETLASNCEVCNPLDLELTPDGGYLISGFADRDNPDVNGGISREGYLLKVDANGNTEWDSVYVNKVISGGTLFFYDMTVTQDGNYLIMATYTAKLKSDGWSSCTASLLMKINPQGEIIWEKSLGIIADGQRTWLKNVSEAVDGTILLGGDFNFNEGQVRGKFLKLTPLGEVLWERYYTHGAYNGDHYIEKSLATSDGGMVGCGMAKLGGTPQDGWLIKLDCNGCLDATCVDDGVTCATYNCADDAQPDALFSVPAPPYQAPPSENYTLNITNESTYSGAYEWYIDNVYQGTYVNPSFDLLSGATYEIKLIAKNMTCQDEYVMTITVDAVLSTPSISPQGGGLRAYPNPTSGVMEILSDEVMEKIEVMDVTGKIVYNAELRIKNYELDLGYLESGVYYLKVWFVNGGVNYRKVVKE